MRIVIFSNCIEQINLGQTIGDKFEQLLLGLNVEIVPFKFRGCCGYDAFEIGEWTTAANLGSELLSASKQVNFNYFVCLSYSCSYYLRKYFGLHFQHDAQHHDFNYFHPKIISAVEFLAAQNLKPTLKETDTKELIFIPSAGTRVNDSKQALSFWDKYEELNIELPLPFENASFLLDKNISKDSKIDYLLSLSSESFSAINQSILTDDISLYLAIKELAKKDFSIQEPVFWLNLFV